MFRPTSQTKEEKRRKNLEITNEYICVRCNSTKMWKKIKKNEKEDQIELKCTKCGLKYLYTPNPEVKYE